MKRTLIATAVATMLLGSSFAQASSHREAPLIAQTPKLDGTDFYMFRSYESGRAGYVTFIANYQPLQDAYGGPNYFSLDPNAVYAIHVDNNGDAVEDVSFEFRIKNTYRNLTVPVNGVSVAVPLSNIGQFGSTATANDGVKNLIETYSVTMVRGGKVYPGTNLANGGRSFRKPFDNIGTKSIPNYAAYANSHISRLGLGGCAGEARVFVGQRNDGFSVNLGEIFDLINLNPVGAPDGRPNIIADKNVSSFALEVPIACLTTGGSPIIGAWTTASKPDNNTMRQVSRLSAPLVNEVVIGLPDKDKFNASKPRNDGQFATYVTNPTLPALIEILFPGVQAPTKFPRTDLVAAFLQGITGVNRPVGVVASDMLRHVFKAI